MAERPIPGEEAVEAPTEDLVGWIRVTLGGLATGLLPLWILFTVTLAQVHPDLRADLVYVDGAFMEVERSMFARLAAGGLLSALAMVGLGALLAPVAAVMGFLRQRRQEVPSLPVDLDPALVAGATWDAEPPGVALDGPAEDDPTDERPVTAEPDPPGQAPPTTDDPPDADPETGDDEDLDALFR